ncbi:MAG: hypothetical protein AAFO04_01575 [Cyanobacteria bacterium J06592_8]
MRLLPQEKFTLRTPEPLSKIIERLEAKIEAPKTFRWRVSRNHPPYAGTISEDGFKIYRIIHYRNSFLPIIRGEFQSFLNETQVHITMSLHPFILAFLIFWFSTFFSVLIPIVLHEILSENGLVFPETLFLGLPIFVLFTFWCAFWYEANYSRNELTQIITEKPSKINSSRNKNSTILWSVIIATIFIVNLLFFTGRGEFLSFPLQTQQSLVSKFCSENQTQSPYCDFSEAYTLEGYPSESAIAISSDGKILVSGGEDKAIKIWDLQTGKLKKIRPSDSGVINTLALSFDGKTVVSGSGDRMIRIWDMTSDQPPKMLKGHSANIGEVQITSDGKTIISQDYKEIKVWDLETGTLQKTLPNSLSRQFKIGLLVIEDNASYFNPIKLSSSGITLVKKGNNILVWDVIKNQHIPLERKWFDNEHIYSAQISFDGKKIVMTSYQQPKNYLKIWDSQTGKLQIKQQFRTAYIRDGLASHIQSGLYDLTLTRDRIIGSTKDNKLKIWNLETAELEATLNTEKMRDLVVSADGKVLAGIIGNSYNHDTQIKVLKR